MVAPELTAGLSLRTSSSNVLLFCRLVIVPSQVLGERTSCLPRLSFSDHLAASFPLLVSGIDSRYTVFSISILILIPPSPLLLRCRVFVFITGTSDLAPYHVLLRHRHTTTCAFKNTRLRLHPSIYLKETISFKHHQSTPTQSRRPHTGSLDLARRLEMQQAYPVD